MSQADDYFKDYTNFTRDLKIWLLTYGVGAPVVFLTSSELFEAIRVSGSALLITISFLLGAFLQIAESLISKWTSWVLYSYAEKDEQESEVGKMPPIWMKNFSDVWMDSIWIRLLIDFIALLSFVAGSIFAFKALL